MNPHEVWILLGLGLASGVLIGMAWATDRRQRRPDPPRGLLTADELFDLVYRQLPAGWAVSLAACRVAGGEANVACFLRPVGDPGAGVEFPIGPGSLDGEIVERQVLAALRHAQDRVAEGSCGE